MREAHCPFLHRLTRYGDRNHHNGKWSFAGFYILQTENNHSLHHFVSYGYSLYTHVQPIVVSLFLVSIHFLLDAYEIFEREFSQ